MMPNIAMRLALIGLMLVLGAGGEIPASARAAGNNETRRTSGEFAAQKKRPRVTIHPRRVYPGPNAKRIAARGWRKNTASAAR